MHIWSNIVETEVYGNYVKQFQARFASFLFHFTHSASAWNVRPKQVYRMNWSSEHSTQLTNESFPTLGCSRTEQEEAAGVVTTSWHLLKFPNTFWCVRASVSRGDEKKERAYVNGEKLQWHKPVHKLILCCTRVTGCASGCWLHSVTSFDKSPLCHCHSLIWCFFNACAGACGRPSACLVAYGENCSVRADVHVCMCRNSNKSQATRFVSFFKDPAFEHLQDRCLHLNVDFFLYVFIYILQMFNIPSWPWITKRAEKRRLFSAQPNGNVSSLFQVAVAAGLKKKKRKEIQNSSCWQIHLAIWTHKPKISSSCSSSALSHELFAGCSPPCPSSPPLDAAKSIKNP